MLTLEAILKVMKHEASYGESGRERHTIAEATVPKECPSELLSPDSDGHCVDTQEAGKTQEKPTR